MRRLAVLSSVVLPQPPKAFSLPANQLVLSGAAPIIRIPINPGSANLLLSGVTPIITVSDNAALTSGAGSLVLSSDAPTLSIISGFSAIPAAASLVLTGATPIRSIDIVITPAVASLVLSAEVPTAVLADPFAVSDRYWTAQITSYNGSTATGLAELELHGTVGGSDQLTGGSATVSTYNGGDTTTYAASHVYDNSTATVWISGSNGVDIGEYWKFDAGSGNTVSAVEAVVTCVSTTNMAPKSIWFAHSSDNSTWKVAFGVTGETGWSSLETRTFANPKLDATSAHAYWAVMMIDNAGTNSYILSTLEMRATSGGADQCSGGTPLGDGWTNLSNLFDANGTTNASKSLVSNGNGWAGYHFGSSVNVTEIALKIGDTFTLAAPNHITIMCSDDGVSWTPSWSATAGGWSSGGTKIFTKP